MKKTFSLTLLLASLSFTFSCANWIKTASRPELDDHDTAQKPVDERSSETATIAKPDASRMSDKDLDKYAYELGLDPSKPLSEVERQDVITRRKLRQLERGLDSSKERANYSRILPLFNSDQEKIEYLSIPSLEGRQAWVTRNKIWNRDKMNDDIQAVADAQDITLGMSQDLVRKSWGEPASVEHSGNPIYKNERWKYIRDLPTVSGYKRQRRYVYFEAGRVVGWETE